MRLRLRVLQRRVRYTAEVTRRDAVSVRDEFEQRPRSDRKITIVSAPSVRGI